MERGIPDHHLHNKLPLLRSKILALTIFDVTVTTGEASMEGAEPEHGSRCSSLRGLQVSTTPEIIIKYGVRNLVLASGRDLVIYTLSDAMRIGVPTVSVPILLSTSSMRNTVVSRITILLSKSL
jgi:hypothetical protein